MAPPNTYTNMSTNNTGYNTASSSCSGTCRIFNSERRAKVSTASPGPNRRTGPSVSRVSRSSTTDCSGCCFVAIAGLFLCLFWSGQGQEYLIKTGLPQGEFSDINALTLQFSNRGRGSGHIIEPNTNREPVGARFRRSLELPDQRGNGSTTMFGAAHAQLKYPRTHNLFELTGSSLCRDTTLIEHRDAVC